MYLGGGGKLHKVVKDKGVDLEKVQCFNFLWGGSVSCHHFEMFLILKKSNKRCIGQERWAKGKHGFQAQLSGPLSEGGEDGGSGGD